MTNNSDGRILAEIDRLDIGNMTTVARRASGDPAATIVDGWTCKPLSALSVSNGTLGFFKIEGAASTTQGVVPWSCVIKAMEPSGTGPGGRFNDPRREIEAYRSNYFATNRTGMRAASCYRVDDRPDGTVWLWLQDLSDAWTEAWPKNHYISAARQIGLFNGALPESKAPVESWLDRTGASDRRRGPLHPGSIFYPLEQALTEPLVQRAVEGIGITRAARLRDDLTELIDATAKFPQTVAHNDCHTRNLFCVPTDDDEPDIYAIDWASVGLSPAGLDCGSLAASGFTWGHREAELVSTIESDIFAAYYSGLVEARWRQSRTEIRLVYLSAVATYTLQNLMIIHQLAIDSPLVDLIKVRIDADPEQAADEISERLTWMVPLVDEALALATALG